QLLAKCTGRAGCPSRLIRVPWRLECSRSPGRRSDADALACPLWPTRKPGTCAPQLDQLCGLGDHHRRDSSLCAARFAQSVWSAYEYGLDYCQPRNSNSYHDHSESAWTCNSGLDSACSNDDLRPVHTRHWFLLAQEHELVNPPCATRGSL